MTAEENLRRIAEIRELLSQAIESDLPHLADMDYEDRDLILAWQDQLAEADELLSGWQVGLEAEQIASLFPRKVGTAVQGSNQIGECGAS